MDVVTGALGNLLPKLLQLLGDEYKLQKGLREEVQYLSVELESIYAALRKVGEVPPERLDPQVQIWARQVREASYDMEDLLDTFLVRVDGRQQEPAAEMEMAGRLGPAVKTMGLFSKAKARHDIAGAIQDIKKQLQEAADRRARYKIDEAVAIRPAAAGTSSVDPRLSALYAKASQLVGIDDPRDGLIEMLSMAEEEIKIISIVGSGGLGKTTLAKAVYDKVGLQFDCRAFVPVGQNPDPRKVLRDILVDLNNDTTDLTASMVDDTRYTGADLTGLDERQLINQVRQFLARKRYFIVVDDVWDTSIWGIITNALVESKRGSRVVVTSRKSQVSEEISSNIYRIKELSLSNSRILFYTRIFGHKDQWPDNDQVNEVSQKILHKCHGVPLAIISIASLLATRPTEDWPNVYKSIGFGHDDNPQVKNMKKILSFSYYDLPCHLRTCMLYLSLFPEDFYIEKVKLIWMWIAEGLVHAKEGKSLSEVADTYFHELVNRGMVMPFEGFGSVRGCRVHDMVVHMIRDIAREENFFALQGSDEHHQSLGNVRRLALCRARLVQVDDKGMAHLRSFSAISCCTDKIIPPVSRLQFLRVLALEHCHTMEGNLHIEHIGKLLHLRYLGLRFTPTRELPKEIGNLKFLQTLLLQRTGIKQLPKSLGRLEGLMCLHADYNTRAPDWIGKLTSLEDLYMCTDAEDKCFVKELGKLRNLRVLRGRISVQDEGQAIYFFNSVSSLQKIEDIMMGASGDAFVLKDAAFMQRSLVLHCNLRHLDLAFLFFPRLPAMINPQALPKLCSMFIFFSEVNQQDLEIIGMFPKLCFLYLCVIKILSNICICGGDRFQNLKSFHASLYPLKFLQGAMPSLEDIDLRIPVLDGKVYNLSPDFGLGNLSSLQRVAATIECNSCFPAEVEEVEAALRHAVDTHPNRPTLKSTRKSEDSMVKDSEDSAGLLERQRRRGSRLRERVNDEIGLQNLMLREAVEMADLKTDLNLSDTKNKVHRFRKQFIVTVNRVQHELPPVKRDEPQKDRDLKRVMEDNAALERVLEILSLESQRFTTMLEELRTTFSVQGVSRLEVINVNICVRDVKVDNPGLDFGFGNLSMLQGIKAHIDCYLCFPTELEEVEAELRHAVHIHPNRPTLEIIKYWEDEMVEESGSVGILKRQKCRAGTLSGLLRAQEELHEAIHQEVVQIGKLKTSWNLRSANDKVQQFLDQFEATKNRVQNELLPLVGDIPPQDRDLNRVIEDIAALERALHILSTEYARVTAMLEELRTQFGLQGAMARIEVTNLNICVRDIMVDNPGSLEFGLENFSSLQEVKAHIDCYLCFPMEAEQVESKLRHAVSIHPNRPTLNIIRYWEDEMVNSDSQLLERHRFRVRTLRRRVKEQIELHGGMHGEAVEMGKLPKPRKLKTYFSLRGANNNKLQRFLKQSMATYNRVMHDLVPVEEDTPIQDRDLRRTTEDIAALERALEILTVEYPRSAAVLEELRTAFQIAAREEGQNNNQRCQSEGSVAASLTY